MELSRALRVVGGVARVLALLHGSGIVHRDLKPANIVLDAASDRPWLVDFGLAVAPDSRRMTSERTVMGSPVYMAPERFVKGPAPGPGWDTFALGIILFELVTGQVPFRARSMGSQYQLVRAAARPSLARDGRSVPQEVDGLFELLCSPQPELRPSAHAVASHVEGLLSRLPSPKRPRSADPVAGLVTGFEGLHFLLVDDEPGDRFLMREAMTRIGLGSQCVEARNGREAIEILRGLRPGSPGPPWVLITDLSMPGMDGNELIHEVQGDPTLEDTPIVVASSCVECGHILDASPFEVDAVISKSDIVRQLLRALAPLGGRRRAGPGREAPRDDPSDP